MRYDLMIVFLIITGLGVIAIFDKRRPWVRMASIWSLLVGAISLLAIAFLFGFRLVANRFESQGGTWSNELGAVIPVARELLGPFCIVMAVWVVLLGVLALRR